MPTGILRSRHSWESGSSSRTQPMAPTISRVFEMYASGNVSLKEIVARARGEGLTFKGQRIQKSTLGKVLRNQIYSGDFMWEGVFYPGKYEGVISREMWEQVKARLDDHGKSSRHRIKHDYAFSGMVRCAHCDCMLVAEKQKAHVYYRCHPTADKCTEKCVREDRLVDGFAAKLRDLVVPAEVTQWLRDTYVESDTTERAARERAIKQHQQQINSLESKIDELLDLRLRKGIDTARYEAKSSELLAQQETLRRRIEQLRPSTPAPVGFQTSMNRQFTRAPRYRFATSAIRSDTFPSRTERSGLMYSA
jgi:site-specific DNA recombinase